MAVLAVFLIIARGTSAFWQNVPGVSLLTAVLALVLRYRYAR